MFLALILVAMPLWSGAATPRVNEPVQPVEDRLLSESDDGCIVGNYVCYTIPEQLHPSVRSQVFVLYLVGTFLPFGWLWGPLVLIDGANLTQDVLITFLVLYVVETVAAFVPLGSFVAAYYITPVTMLRAWSRALDGEGDEENRPARSRKSRPRYGDDPVDAELLAAAETVLADRGYVIARKDRKMGTLVTQPETEPLGESVYRYALRVRVSHGDVEVNVSCEVQLEGEAATEAEWDTCDPADEGQRNLQLRARKLAGAIRELQAGNENEKEEDEEEEDR